MSRDQDLQPGTETIVPQLISACRDNLGDDLVSLVIQGSAAKGGIIPGSSDLDYVMFVRPSCLTGAGELEFGRAVGLHRSLSRIDPAPFRYLQGSILPVDTSNEFGLIHGTFVTVFGDPDVPTLPSDKVLDAACKAIQAVDAAKRADALSYALLDTGEYRLERAVRGLTTQVWPILCHIAKLIRGDERAWRFPKTEIVSGFANDPILGSACSAWLERVTEHHAKGERVETGLETLQAGLAVYEAVEHWRAAHPELLRAVPGGC